MGNNGNARKNEQQVPLGDEMDPQLGQKLLETEVITGLRGLADVAQDKLSSTTSVLGPADIDRQLRSEAREALSADEQLAMAEMNVLLAKYGQTPANSVEGLIKLRKMLVRLYKDNSLVPAKTRNELAVLERNLAVVEETRELFINRRITEERAKGNKSQVEALKSQWEINATEIDIDVQEIEKHSVVDTAHTRALEVQIDNKKKKAILRNEDAVLDKVVDNDRLEKKIDAHRKTASIVWTKLLGPVLRPLIQTVVVIAVLGVLFSLFIELSKTPMYPLVAPFNDLRHLILDPVWLTIKNAMDSAFAPKS